MEGNPHHRLVGPLLWTPAGDVWTESCGEGETPHRTLGCSLWLRKPEPRWVQFSETVFYSHHTSLKLVCQHASAHLCGFYFWLLQAVLLGQMEQMWGALFTLLKTSEHRTPPSKHKYKSCLYTKNGRRFYRWIHLKWASVWSRPGEGGAKKKRLAPAIALG